MIWFTSDFHFDHANIIKYSNRPFKTVDEMNLKLIDNFNSVVAPDDDVYILGDICFNTRRMVYMAHLNGKKRYIRGNHDYHVKSDYDILEISPEGLTDEYDHKRSIVLCHYPMRSWNKMHYASWHLYGHQHGTMEPYGLSFDIGVDTNNYFPVSLEDVKKRMANLQPIIDYRKERRR